MNNQPKRPGRKPMDPAERRDTVLRFKTKASTAAAFKRTAQQRGFTQSAAIRDALVIWLTGCPECKWKREPKERVDERAPTP